jgi:hypothetical protein
VSTYRMPGGISTPCPKCGWPFNRGSVDPIFPSFHASIGAIKDDRYCPKCGKQLWETCSDCRGSGVAPVTLAGDRFCSFCGRELIQVVKPPKCRKCDGSGETRITCPCSKANHFRWDSQASTTFHLPLRQEWIGTRWRTDLTGKTSFGPDPITIPYQQREPQGSSPTSQATRSNGCSSFLVLLIFLAIIFYLLSQSGV